MTLHHTSHDLVRTRWVPLTTLSLAALLLLQSCTSADAEATWTPTKNTSTAYLEDSVVTSRVKAALLVSPVVRSIDIGVESHQGVVLLSGMVADQTQLDLARFVALNVPGVEKVDSLMYFSGTPAVLASPGNVPAATSLPLAPQRKHRDGSPRASVIGQPMAATVPPGVQLSEDAQTVAPAPPMVRLARLTSSVLGLSSIHDELQIKR